jgi:hypothetical protein
VVEDSPPVDWLAFAGATGGGGRAEPDLEPRDWFHKRPATTTTSTSAAAARRVAVNRARVADGGAGSLPAIGAGV